MPTLQEGLRALERSWTRGEIEADLSTLDALTTDDFMLVGPAGFVLDKQQWLDRYRAGDLRTRSLSFEPAATRVYGDAAVTIGRLVQEAEYRGRPAGGEFRATLFTVRDDSRRRLAGQHLSAIGGPPPSSGPDAEEEKQR